MIFQTIQYAAISLVFIAVVHYLIRHLTDNLTTPQVRDIVSSTNNHYKAIMRRLDDAKGGRNGIEASHSSTSMKDDLKSYLQGFSGQRNSGGNMQGSGVGIGASGQEGGVAGTTALQPGTSANLLTYDSTESVFGDYDSGDTYSTY